MDIRKPDSVHLPGDVKTPKRQEEGFSSEGYADEGVTAVDIDPVIEKRVRRKLDRHLMPLLFLLFMVAFLDRSNIGNAETAGMSKSLGFDNAHFEVCRKEPAKLGLR
jgi:hypothetical protein